jgi:hypothetical protein
MPPRVTSRRQWAGLVVLILLPVVLIALILLISSLTAGSCACVGAPAG